MVPVSSSAPVILEEWFIDDYIVDENKDSEALQSTIYYLSGEKTYSSAVLNQVIQAAQRAIHRFKDLAKIREISLRLSPDNVKKGSPQDKLIETFLTQDLVQSIGDLKIHFIDGRKISEKASLLADFAIRFFQQLNPIQKSHIKHLFELIPPALNYHIVPENEAIELSNRLHPLFNQTVKTVSLSRKNTLERETIHIGSFIVPKEWAEKQKRAYEQEQKKIEAVQKKQIDTLALCLKRIVQTYVPSFYPPKPEGTVDHMTKDQFDSMLPGIVKEIFFTEPRAVTSSDKKLILFVLKKLDLFLDWVARKDKHLEEHNIEKEAIDTQIYSLINKAILMKNEVTFKPEETFIEKFIHFFSVTSFFNGLQISITPIMILTVMDRILTFPFDSLKDDRPDPPMEYMVEDKQFKFDAGLAIASIAKKGLALWVDGSMVQNELASRFIDAKKEEWAGEILYFVAKVLATDCSMKPLIISTHILLDGQNPVFPPKNKPSITIQERMNTNIYVMLQPKIKEAAGILSGITEWAVSLKPTLNSVGKNLDILLNDPFALKVLTLHLLNGACEYLQEMKKN